MDLVEKKSRVCEQLVKNEIINNKVSIIREMQVRISRNYYFRPVTLANIKKKSDDLFSSDLEYEKCTRFWVEMGKPPLKTTT